MFSARSHTLWTICPSSNAMLFGTMQRSVQRFLAYTRHVPHCSDQVRMGTQFVFFLLTQIGFGSAGLRHVSRASFPQAGCFVFSMSHMNRQLGLMGGRVVPTHGGPDFVVTRSAFFYSPGSHFVGGLEGAGSNFWRNARGSVFAAATNGLQPLEPLEQRIHFSQTRSSCGSS